jgi:hypothetical protein
VLTPADQQRQMRRRLPRLLRWIAIYLALTGIAVTALLLELWPYRPSSLAGWALLLLAALPVMLLGELVGTKLLQNPVSDAVQRGTQRSKFSWIRIGYLVFLFILVISTIAFILDRIWKE